MPRSNSRSFPSLHPSLARFRTFPLHLMARFLARALIHFSCFSHRTLSALLLPLRRLSHGRIVEIDLAAGGDASEGEVETDAEAAIDVISLRRLEDAIHAISIRRSAPDWLPFDPGSSYWVPPPRRAVGVAEVVRKLANPLTDEEHMSLTTIRGWPSSSFFVEGVTHSVKKNLKTASAQSDDDE